MIILRDIKLLDTTLREGAQAPSVNYTPEQRLNIARSLDEFGIDFIEVGHPAVSNSVLEGIQNISKEELSADLLAHSRAMKEDIDLAIESDVDWVGIFLCVSDQSLQDRFSIELDEALEKIRETIEYAKDHGLNVRFTPEDTTRTEWENVEKAFKAAKDAGADRFSVADTTGSSQPLDFYKTVTQVVDLGVPTNVHCHNDLGMALANAVMGIEAGASLIDASINGLGERSGIVDLAQISTTLKHHYDINKYELERLSELSQIIQDITEIEVQDNYPIVGENAFVHKSGLHVSAVVENPNSYEFMPAEKFGRERKIFLDRYSGRDSVKYHLNRNGIPANEKIVSNLLQSIKNSSRAYTQERLISEAKKLEGQYVNHS